MAGGGRGPQGWGHRIDCGDVDEVLGGGCDRVVQGDIRIGGQEHFYLGASPPLHHLLLASAPVLF